jgi:hypothetical protein
MYTVIVNLQVKPDMTEAHRGAPHYEKWRAAAAELLDPGGQVNTFATPAFPGDLPEARR